MVHKHYRPRGIYVKIVQGKETGGKEAFTYSRKEMIMRHHTPFFVYLMTPARPSLPDT